jgi:DNA-directed RNA polymerase specialized sigma24 family protein
MMTHRRIAASGQARSESKGRVTLEREITRLLATKNWEGALYLAAISYGPELLEFLVNRMPDEDDARDVLSMTLEDACSDVSSFVRQATFRTWLYILAKNARARFLQDPYRHRGRRSTRMSSLADSTILGSPTLTKLDIDRIRRDFDDDDQELLTLSFERQLSWAEIAAIWNVGREPLDAASLRARCQRLIQELTERWGFKSHPVS